MGDRISITGGRSLRGKVCVSGAKNAALPILIAGLLSAERSKIANVPGLEDIDVLLRLLKSLGAEATFYNNTVEISASHIPLSVAPYSLVRAMRASFLVLGPLLARTHKASVSLPGGDAIGGRPVNIHLEGLTKMGASITINHGMVQATAPGGLRPAKIELDFPSVGATEHLMMTAALVEGETVITGAAREPEIIELAEFLTSMGASISGAGSSEVRINGKNRLGAGTHTVRGDRIEALTFLTAAAMTRGEVLVEGIEADRIEAVLTNFRDAGCEVVVQPSGIFLRGPQRLKPFTIKTGPFPEFPTDAQPLLMAAATVADGESLVTENIFESRFGHVAEFRRFGAEITLKERSAIINGLPQLSGAPVEASDIRAGAGLVLMALVADGVSSISEVHHLDRGYADLIHKLQSLGAAVCRLPSHEHRELVVGC